MNFLTRMTEYRGQLQRLAIKQEEPFKVIAVSNNAGFEFAENITLLKIVNRTAYTAFHDLKALGLADEANKIIAELNETSK